MAESFSCLVRLRKGSLRCIKGQSSLIYLWHYFRLLGWLAHCRGFCGKFFCLFLFCFGFAWLGFFVCVCLVFLLKNVSKNVTRTIEVVECVFSSELYA